MTSALFKVAMVFEILSRGRCVAGDIVEGTLRIGMSLRPQGQTRPGSWRIVGVEFVDWVSERRSHVALVLENAPPLDELQRLLPTGSILISDEVSSVAPQPPADTGP